MTLRDIAIRFGFEIDRNSEQNAENRIEGLKNFATKVLGTIAIGFSFVNMNALAEEFNSINDQIKDATREFENQEEVQQKILKAANDTKSSYGDTAKVVSNLVKENSEIFGSVDDAIAFNNATTKLFKTAGKGSDEINGLQEAINKSFAKGAVDSETISVLLEQSPEAVKLLNKQLNISTDKLEELASDGKIALTDLRDTFLNNTEEINKNFDALDYSISDALLNIRNQWGLFCDSLWVGSGITNGVGKLMVRAFTSFMDTLKKLQPLLERIIKSFLNGVQKAFHLIFRVSSYLGQLIHKLGGIEKALKLVGIAASTIFLLLNAGKIIGFLKDVGKMMSGINLKILLIVAVVVMLALIIEDFINFMKGNDSVIGVLFEKAGINAEEAREKIKEAWSKIKSFLVNVWEFIKNKATEIFKNLQQFWQEHGTQIKEILGGAWRVISQILKIAFELIESIAKNIFQRLQKFWDRWGSTITSVFQDLWSTLVSLAQPFLDFLQGLIDFLEGVFSGDWEKAWDGIKQMASAFWDMLVEIVSGGIDIFIDLFNGIFEPVLEKIETGWQKVKEWFLGLPEQAKQWGKDFLDGLVNGIKEKITAVTDAIKGVANKIKSFLHFSVPDEGPLTDYESWMPDFMKGLAIGIDENSDIVFKKIKELTSGMATLTQAATANVATAAKSVVNSTTSNMIQNVNISNSYTGSERKVQQNVSKAMNKSAEDATAYMAKGLAYTRG